MDRQEKEQLLYLLEKLFAENDINARNAMQKNPAFELIKNEMVAKGRWKLLPRGKTTPNNLQPARAY